MQPIVTDRVAWSVCHSREPFKNGWTDRDAIWHGLRWAKGSMCQMGGCILAQPGKCDWTVHVRRHCGLILNYFDHLVVFHILRQKI